MHGQIHNIESKRDALKRREIRKINLVPVFKFYKYPLWESGYAHLICPIHHSQSDLERKKNHEEDDD